MKAVVKTKEGAGNITYMDFPKPEVAPGIVLIKVSAAGICGTDLKIREGSYWSNPPVVLGHEYSGIVEAVGEGVTGFKPGDRVISETAGIVCGKCEYCLSGNYLMCVIDFPSAMEQMARWQNTSQSGKQSYITFLMKLH